MDTKCIHIWRAMQMTKSWWDSAINVTRQAKKYQPSNAVFCHSTAKNDKRNRFRYLTSNPAQINTYEHAGKTSNSGHFRLIEYIEDTRDVKKNYYQYTLLVIKLRLTNQGTQWNRIRGSSYSSLQTQKRQNCWTTSGNFRPNNSALIPSSYLIFCHSNVCNKSWKCPEWESFL